MSLLWERLSPYIGGLIITVLAYFRLSPGSTDKILDRLMEPTINVFAIIMGFIAALLAIVVAQPENRLLRVIGTSKVYSSIFIGYIRQAFYLAFSVTMLSGGLLLLDHRDIQHCRFATAIWLGLVSASIFASQRIVRQLWRVLRSSVHNP